MTSTASNGFNGSDTTPAGVFEAFTTRVIDRVAVRAGKKALGYAEYIALPESARSNDEANAVDQQFAQYCLEWLGFGKGDWNYNQPQNGQKSNRPDYVITGSIGPAFIWEDKNTTLDLDVRHLEQMRRYCVGTAGYAVWCNMRRILAVRFLSSDTLRYDTLADVRVADLFGAQPPLEEFRQTQISNLALFHLLFSKARFTEFTGLTSNIAIPEADYAAQAVALEDAQAIRRFTANSRQSLESLRLAALAQIYQALAHGDAVEQQQHELEAEWADAGQALVGVISHNQDEVRDALDKLRPGEAGILAIRGMEQVILQSQGTRQLAASLRSHFDKWLDRVNRINSVLYSRRFETIQLTRIADAYRIWGSRQSEQEDVRPEIFAEQVAYVFFVRLLLVRVLEDKQVLEPRIASDGGFADWLQYVTAHFKELNGVSILSDNFSSLLARKAGHYYLHFFQQPVFDWFTPDDYLLVRTLEFLYRYTFRSVGNDIIGFTYEEYIDRTARNRKGHFLTRPQVVEYMLDLLDYDGPVVLGRRVLDPACGSGSFLVHAARRYRAALVTELCRRNKLPDEAALNAEPTLRQKLAADYIQALTTLFFGMELNPFACYLAEMNLLIQSLDDLHYLQQVLQEGERFEGIERFEIINTNSLDLPREVLDEPHMTGAVGTIAVPDRLSDRLADEAYPIKARKDQHTQGFSYIIFNPPYVNSRQEDLNLGALMHTPFFATALSGDTNLYLLFLKLGTYYLADNGQIACIIPLTIFGDRSASAARRLLRTRPFTPAAAVRFYRGDILFPGVDQAVGIVRVNRAHSSAVSAENTTGTANAAMRVSGGFTVPQAQAAQFTTDAAKVVDVVPQNDLWNGAWLVSNSETSLDVWQQAKTVSGGLTHQLGALLNKTFDIRQGDVNATHLNPLRLGATGGSHAKGHVAVYKGESINTLAPLPSSPPDWAAPLQANLGSASTTTIAASQSLTYLQQITSRQSGIVLRQVARLNTRERLILTWFERLANTPIAFTNELWRMALKPGESEQAGKALLALLNSSVIVFLINLFSTNNHVGRDELTRLPIPDPAAFPEQELANLAAQMLKERAGLETGFVAKYGAILPDFEEGDVYVPPSAVLYAEPIVQLRFADLILRGEVDAPLTVSAQTRIRALNQRGALVNSIPPETPYAAAFGQTLSLFIEEMIRRNLTWQEAQNARLPDPIAAPKWLGIYMSLAGQAQQSWQRFGALQRQADAVVADWYGFDGAMRATIAAGLPWARRQRPATSVSAREQQTAADAAAP